MKNFINIIKINLFKVLLVLILFAGLILVPVYEKYSVYTCYSKDHEINYTFEACLLEKGILLNYHLNR
jgi:hypothetical protein